MTNTTDEAVRVAEAWAIELKKKALLVNGAAPSTSIIPPGTKAFWRNEGPDLPITVMNIMEVKDGVTWYYTAEHNGGTPENQIILDTPEISPVNQKISMKQEALRYAALRWYVIPLHQPLFDKKTGDPNGCTCEAYRRSDKYKEWLESKGLVKKFDPDYKCRTPGKHPRFSDWEDKASCEPDQIKVWWEKWPGANIGIAAGRSGLLDVDQDSYKDNFGGVNLLTFDEQKTPTNLSGGGGEHLVYLMPEGKAYGNETGDLPKGIDIRGCGGQFVAPPSLHPSGRRYQWEDGFAPWELEPQPLPQKLITILDAAASSSTARPVTFSEVTTEKPELSKWRISKEIHELIANPPPAGERSEADYSVCLSLCYAGATNDDILAVFEHSPVGTQGKFAEAGQRYLAITIGKARAFMEANPRKNKLSTGPYAVENGRIGEWRETKDPDTGEKIEVFYPLCNFNAWVVADVAADDGEETTRKIAIAGTLDNDIPLPEIEIGADEFEAMKWPVARWGARINIQPWDGVPKKLRHAIQLLSAENMTDRRTLTHTGWTVIDNQHFFLHAGGALGNDNVSVALPRNLSNYHFPDDNAIDPVEAMRESIKLLDIAPARVSAPLWAAMFLGPLSEFIPPVFTLSVEGGSGSLKSSYAAVMLNHYGKKFTEYAMPADWLATANSLEKLCFHAKDIPLVIDDLRPSTNPAEARQLQEAVSRITRATGNRQGRSRLDANSEFKRTYAPRGVVIMTAERKALGKSTNSRILTIDVEPGDINSALLGVAQKQRHIYAYAMAGFIRSVAKDWEQLSVDLPAQVADLRAANAGNGHHLRLPNATAILHTAFCCAMSYAIEIGAITEGEADRYIRNCYKALQDMAESQNQATEAEDPARKYITIIASLIAQEKAYLMGKGKPNIGVSMAEKMGWHDGANVFLLPGAYNSVCKYATAEGWTFPSDESTLRKELERGGYITKRQTGALTTKQRDPDNQKLMNVTAISFDKLKELLIEMGYDFNQGSKEQ